MKGSKVLLVVVILAMLAALIGCAAPAPAPAPASEEQAAPAAAPADQAKKTYKDLVVGYAQLGAESEWRTANTASVKEAAEELGITLKFSDAQQKQENQIKAIRSFIAQKVDVIGVPPVVETGWETVFQEAKDAGIPIILVDRRADVPEDLYVTYLGSDFVEEGRKAALEMNKLLPDGGKIVELVGQYLQTIKSRGISVLLIEQKLTIAMKISDRALVMGHGSIVFQGTPDSLRADSYIRKEWLEV